MSNRKPYRPVITGISFHPEVKQYLDQLSVEEDLDRSALVNRIVREHALRHEPAPTEPPQGRILGARARI